MSFGDLFDQPDLYFDTYANIPLQNNTITMMPNGEAELKYGDDRGAMITGQNAQLASFVGTIGGPQHATSETEHLPHRFHFHPSTEQFTPLSAHTHSSRAEHQAMQTHHPTGIAEASTIPSIPSGQLPRGTPFSRPLRLRPLHPIPDRDAAAPQNIARTRASLQELQHSRRGRQRAVGSSAGFPPVWGAVEMMASTGMERGGQSSDEHRRHGSPQAIPFSIGSPSSATSSEPVETLPVVATPELDAAHHTFTMGNALPVTPDDNVFIGRMEYLPNILIGPHSSGSCYPTPAPSQTYSGMVDTSATEQWVRALDMSETHCQPVGQPERGRHHWHTYGPPQDLGLFLPAVQTDRHTHFGRPPIHHSRFPSSSASMEIRDGVWEPIAEVAGNGLGLRSDMIFEAHMSKDLLATAQQDDRGRLHSSSPLTPPLSDCSSSGATDWSFGSSHPQLELPMRNVISPAHSNTSSSSAPCDQSFATFNTGQLQADWAIRPDPGKLECPATVPVLTPQPWWLLTGSSSLLSPAKLPVDQGHSLSENPHEYLQSYRPGSQHRQAMPQPLTNYFSVGATPCAERYITPGIQSMENPAGQQQQRFSTSNIGYHSDISSPPSPPFPLPSSIESTSHLGQVALPNQGPLAQYALPMPSSSTTHGPASAASRTIVPEFLPSEALPTLKFIHYEYPVQSTSGVGDVAGQASLPATGPSKTDSAVRTSSPRYQPYPQDKKANKTRKRIIPDLPLVNGTPRLCPFPDSKDVPCGGELPESLYEAEIHIRKHVAVFVLTETNKCPFKCQTPPKIDPKNWKDTVFKHCISQGHIPLYVHCPHPLCSKRLLRTSIKGHLKDGCAYINRGIGELARCVSMDTIG
ncbi:hypothetical protein BXZ70DRAFT_317138 [Cristinia sonorae]|uniref:Uncharacterized protein n=1 Tax=Cristinia sonorae TaxID=1940300 RepID=A0A8K0UL92_9AGAR|nr:hypothetical protein BXZ70DRAFT_317138 [Cristinia sonorae]